jgi:hypothetical protein
MPLCLLGPQDLIASSGAARDGEATEAKSVIGHNDGEPG